MKKFIILSLFSILLFGTMSYAKERGSSASRLSDVKSISFVKDDNISFFEAENWWLKKYPDVVPNSSYFYMPLTQDKLFAGVYVRFHKNALLMADYVAKGSVTAPQLNTFFSALGKTTKNNALGIKSVTKKNGTMYVLSIDQRPYRLVALSAAAKDISLVKAHLKINESPKQKNENKTKKTPVKKSQKETKR